MENNHNAKLLRIFIGESDKVGDQPLYEAIVFAAKGQSLSGASVIRGIMGFGAKSKIDTAKIFEISADRPPIIGVNDTEENIDNLLKSLSNYLRKLNAEE